MISFFMNQGKKTNFEKLVDVFYRSHWKQLYLGELEAVVCFADWIRKNGIKIEVRKESAKKFLER